MSRDRLVGPLINFSELVYRGIYSNQETYVTNNIVQYESRFWLYIYDAPNSGATPQTPSNFWKDLGGESLIKSGLLAERPLASNDNKGQLYYVTDAAEQRLYYSSGTSWLLVGVAVAATTSKLGLVKLNSNDANPVVYRKQEIDTAISTNALTATSITTTSFTASGTTSVPTPASTDSSNKIATTNFVDNFTIAKDVRFKDIVQGRLSTSSSSNEADGGVSATIHFNPCHPNRPEQISNKGLIGLWVNGAWRLVEFVSTSFSVATLPVDTAYDLFVEYNTTTNLLTISAAQWTSLSARVALYTHEGVLVKSSTELTKRFVGSFLVASLNGNGGITANAPNVRYLWNFYNRINKTVYALNSAAGATFNYNTAVWAQAQYTPQIFLFSGWPVNTIDLHLIPYCVYVNVAVGGAGVYQALSVSVNNGASIQLRVQPTIHLNPDYKYPPSMNMEGQNLGLGKHFFKLDIYSFQPPSGTVQFLPLNAYLGGTYMC